MSARISLYEHALRLHEQDPDGVLPHYGEPYPDEEHRPPRRRRDRDSRLEGADVATVLDGHFSRPDAHPADLAFDDLDVPIHRNEHIVAAALRADRLRVRETGRWLVRHSPDRGAATVGLALLATDWADEDIPLIRIIGLLSERFGPLAADALRRRRDGGEALGWLAQRVAGWGRVYVIEAMCVRGSGAHRDWLLRHACAGDGLDGYYAGLVATSAHLHAAITGTGVDDALIDHTGQVLSTMTYCGGMGMTLGHYPPAPAVLAAHATHLAGQAPAVSRYLNAAVIADHLANGDEATGGADRLPGTAEQREHIVRQYLAVLDRPGWREAARAGIDPASDRFAWFTTGAAARLGLRASPPESPTPPRTATTTREAADHTLIETAQAGRQGRRGAGTRDRCHPGYARRVPGPPRSAPSWKRAGAAGWGEASCPP